MKLTSILEKVIRKTGGLKPPTLGVEIETTSAKIEMLSLTNEDKKQLFGDLREQSKSNNKIVISMIVGCFIIVTSVVSVTLYYRCLPESNSVTLGSLALVLTLLGFITKRTMRILKEKHTMDLIGITIPNLTPEEAMKLIQSIYHEEKKTFREK